MMPRYLLEKVAKVVCAVRSMFYDCMMLSIAPSFQIINACFAVLFRKSVIEKAEQTACFGLICFQTLKFKLQT